MNAVELKSWIYDKISEEAKRYHTFIDVEYINGYYKNNETDTVIALVREVVKETEKAYQITFETGTVDGSAKGWTAWIPKSQIVKVM